MQGITERNSLNWLFGISCMVSGLSFCVWESSNSISGELIGMRSSVYISLDRSWYLTVRVSNIDVILRHCDTALKRTVGGVWETFNFQYFWGLTFHSALVSFAHLAEVNSLCCKLDAHYNCTYTAFICQNILWGVLGVQWLCITHYIEVIQTISTAIVDKNFSDCLTCKFIIALFNLHCCMHST